ncbi:MAG: hypothetical protein ACM3MK_08275 [Chitinophagales bacterium]
MSFPTIPEIAPTISLDRNQVVNLLLASVALEELSLAHVVNTEGEKLQAALGTLPGITLVRAPNLSALLSVNRDVRRTLQTAIMKEMLLEFTLEDVLDIATGSSLPPTPPTPPTPTFVEAGSAWAVGTPYGQGNAQYVTLGPTETGNTFVLGLGATNIPIGTVSVLRQGTNLIVTFTTFFPYVMDQDHLLVSATIPTIFAPGQFPYQYTVTNPADYFTTHTFTVDVSSIPGTIYIAAHAHILQQV